LVDAKHFFVAFEMTTTTKGLMASQLGVRYGITDKNSAVIYASA
jgi:hypothetical protein